MTGSRIIHPRHLDHGGIWTDPPPAGVCWTMIGCRRRDRPVLPVGGHRSIFTAWPPGSFCEWCGRPGREGYAGPVPGDRAVFPSVLLHRVCEPCARRSLGLADGELRGHSCLDRCTDRLHLHLADIDSPAAPGELPDDHPIVRHLARHGWRVADTTPPPREIVDPGVCRIALWVEPVRPLPWPRQREDPWVW